MDSYKKILDKMESKDAPKPVAEKKPSRFSTMSPKTRQKLASYGGGFGALILAIVLAWYFWPVRVPSPNESAATIGKFMATDKFASLPLDQKQPFLDAMEKLPWDDRRKMFSGLSDDQREKMFTNAFLNSRMKTINDFFKLKTQKDKDAFLDKLIDQQQARDAQRTKDQAANAGGQGRGGGGAGRGDPGRMKAMLERVPPGSREKMAGFIGAIHARRDARGLPDTGRR